MHRPINEFPQNPKYLRLEPRAQISEGSAPVKEFFDRSRCPRRDNSVRCELGITPLRPLVERNKPATLTLVVEFEVVELHTTPYHPHGSILPWLSQPLEFTHDPFKPPVTAKRPFNAKSSEFEVCEA